MDRRFYFKITSKKSMNMDENNINKKIEDVMQSIDNISKAAPAPFFFTRLEARMMTEKNVWVKLSSFFARPLVAFACVCLVLLINLTVIFTANNKQETYQQAANEIGATDEYSQVTATLYELDK